MGDATLNTILDALSPYCITESRIKLSGTILGRGGFGDVKLGEYRKSRWSLKPGRPVAVKQLRATGSMAQMEQLALAFAQELQVWAGLAHPHITPLVGFLLDNAMAKAWLISPYMRNGNIRDYLDRQKSTQIVRFRLFGEVARGVAYLHRRNLCHGDIKSANVLVDDEDRAKLCDFGLTELMERGTMGGMTSTGVKGTVRYMPPEFFHEEKPTRTKKSDVWAWSCLGLEILFDQIAYADITLDMVIMAQIIRGTPPLHLDSVVINDEIKQLFRRCWVAQPVDRVTMPICVSVLKDITERLGPKPDKLAATFHGEYRQQGNVEDLHKAVDFYRQAIQLGAKDHPDQIHHAESLALALHDKYMKEGNLTDLNEGIGFHRQALQLRPDDHPDRGCSLENLGLALHDKYEKAGDVSDLYEAIDLHRWALLLRPDGHPDRSSSLENLGLVLRYKYEKDGDVVVLNEMIEVRRQALQLRPKGHSYRCFSLNNLAAALVAKSWKTGEVAHLNEAIDLHRWALELRPDGHLERGRSLNNLGSALSYKYRGVGDVASLHEAIDLLREALLLRPKGHANRQNSLRNVVLALHDKYEADGELADLREAVDAQQEYVMMLSPKSSDLLSEQVHLQELLALQSSNVDWD